MNVTQMLEQRNRVYLEWIDPWPGIDFEEEPVTVCLHQRATVADCLAIARYNAVVLDRRAPSDEADLLLDFIAVMWAEPVEPTGETQE